MFIRYNPTAQYFEYDTSVGQNGAGPWVVLPIGGAGGGVALHHTAHEPGGIDALVNAAWINLKNIFTQDQHIVKVNPVFELSQTSAAVDAKRTRFEGLSDFYISHTNDADNAYIVRFKFARTGDIEIPKGIIFPATNVDSSNPNALDDFEEGTWTPTFQGSTGTATGQVYNVQAGMYTKTGRQVFAAFKVQITNVGSGGAGQLRILGLPFINNNAAPSAGVISFYDQLLGVNTTILSPHITPSGNYFIVWYSAAPGISPSGNLLYSHIQSSTQMIGSVTYMVP